MIRVPLLAALLVLTTGACGLFPEHEEDPFATTSGEPSTTGGTGPLIDPDPSATPPAPRRGVRGLGEFTYDCADTSDPGCLSTYQNPFPAKIAVGGQFLLTYTADDHSSRTPYPASQDRISAVGVYEAQVPGDTAMLVYDPQKGGEHTLRDFITLHAAVPTQAVLRRNDMNLGALFLHVDDEAAVTAFTRDADADDLAGSLKFSFSLEPEGPAAITSFTAGGVRVRAVAPGMATLTATLGDLSASVPISVLATDDPTSTSTDTSTGTSSTDTSTGALQ